MENRVIYRPETLNDIWNGMGDPDPAKDGIMTMADMARIGSVIEERPYGQAMLGWEHQAEKEGHIRENHININWFRLHKDTYVIWNAESIIRFCGQPKGKYERVATTTVIYIRSQAWREVFPERYRMCCDLAARRDMAQKDVYPPKDLIVTEVVDFFCGVFLIATEGRKRYLCSPLGCIPAMNSRLGVGEALRSLGVEIPEDPNDQVWERIKYWWALTSLAV